MKYCGTDKSGISFGAGDVGVGVASLVSLPTFKATEIDSELLEFNEARIQMTMINNNTLFRLLFTIVLSDHLHMSPISSSITIRRFNF